MPTGYRIERSPNARALCKNKECKDSGVKIQKGELRFATLVTIEDKTSWAYKHWGCVTPEQIKHVQAFTEGDMDLLEGYDELPKEDQDKVDFAIKNGHVPDEDWKGDVEVNRPGMKGFRAKPKKEKKKRAKKGEEEEEEEEAEVEEEKPAKPQKKRGRPAKDEEEAEAPAPKKRGRPAKKAVKKEETSDGEAGHASDKEMAAPPKNPKKARSRKTAVPKTESDDEADQPKPKKAKASKVAVKEEDAQDAGTKPAKGRPRKAAAKAHLKDESVDEEEQEEVEIAKPKRGRKKAAP